MPTSTEYTQTALQFPRSSPQALRFSTAIIIQVALAGSESVLGKRSYTAKDDEGAVCRCLGIVSDEFSKGPRLGLTILDMHLNRNSE